MLTAWREKAPPHSHWVMASYSVMEPLRFFRTCRRGCCVDDGICGPMMLPRYWRDATPEEIAKHGWPVRGSSTANGVPPAQGLGYTWHPKECPCKSVQSEDCIENGCKWQRDPTLVPAELRVAAGAEGKQGEPF